MKLNLDRASNMFGPLDDDVRARLEAVIDNPTEETWNDAHSIILRFGVLGDGLGLGITLWQAVGAVTEGKVLEGWKAIPTRETILQAIAYALN